jgi:acyl-CoA thioesterase-1
MPFHAPHIFSLFRHASLQRLVLSVLCLSMIGCEQSSEPVSPSVSPSHMTSAPADGLGQRLGTDVTSQPGRVGIQPRAEQPRIVAFGDSLTAGFGVPPEDSYPAQLQRKLDEAGYQYRVINAGVSGDTTAGGLRRIDWVLKSRPAIVILVLGANDGLRGLDLKETKANLEQIIRRLRAAGVQVVLAGMKLPPNYGADYAERFASLYPELARTHRVSYMPFFLDGVAAKAALNQADGIHPTAAGYRIIVDHMMPVLKPLLMRPALGESGG